ncbi:MAG: InlB B-repeat-containing protein, partial [Clostridia bacterium]|nr:InlB B-repeat-containing protein [Clostridia bacterium]
VIVLGKADLAKENHGFSGWNTSAAGSGSSYIEGDTFIIGAADVELYAQWTEDPSYTVTYDGNTNDTGTAPVDSESPYYTGEEVTVLGENDLAKNNHSFLGWNTAADGSGLSYSSGDIFTMASGNVILYAQWEEDPSYYIIYDGNGHEEGEPPVDLDNPYYVGEAVIALGPNTMLREHFGFDGWNTQPDGEGTDYNAGDVLSMPEGGIVLYARWLPVSYTVTYHEGLHGSLDEPGVNEGLNFGDATPAAPGVTPDFGYLFTGWDPIPTETVEGNADYYAQYIAVDDTLALEKVPSFSGEEPLEIGDEVSYTFTITNHGNVIIKNILLSDPEITFITVPGPFDLAPGHSAVFADIGYHVIDEDDALAGFFTNIARAEGTTDELQRPSVATGMATVLVNSAKPSIILQKEAWADHNPAEAGDKITYEFTVTNNGPVTLYDVYVDDNDIGFTSTRVTLAPGAQHTWILPDFYEVTEDDLFSGDIYNEATAYGWASMATKPVTHTDNATVNVAEPEPKITIEKSVDDNNVYAGQTVVFTMEVENSGNVTLYDVTLTDVLLDVSSYRDFLAPGDSFTVVAEYRTKESDVPGFENLAVAEGYVYRDGEVRATDSASVTVTVRETPPPVPPENWKPAIEVMITPDANNVYAGDEVIFTMVVKNKGNTVLNNVTVVNEALDFNEHITTLFILGSETFTVTRTMTETGSFVFTVYAQGKSPQGVTVDDTDTATVTVTMQEVIIPPVEPPPEKPPENPETGAIPFDAYSVSGLIALGAGIFALVKREKDAEEDEDYDL